MGLFSDDNPHYRAVRAEENALLEASELIAEAMEARSASRADLARALKVSRSEITSRLQGKRNMTIKSLAATLFALDAELNLGMKLPAQTGHTSIPTDLNAYRVWRSNAENDTATDSPRREYYRGKAVGK